MIVRSRHAVRSAALVGCLLLAGNAAAGAAGGPEIKIAAILSYSGPSAPLGLPQVNALKLAEKEINAHGGIDGRPVHFDIVDDGAKADVAQQLATQMLGSGHVALICGTRTDTSAACARVSGASDVVQLYTTPTEGLWRSKSGQVTKNLFQVNPRDQLEAQALLGFAKNHLHAKTIGILHDENLYGTGGAAIAADEAKAMGMTVLDSEGYPGDGTDFTPQITKLKDAKPDVVVLWGATTTPGLAIHQARALGLTQPILGSSGIGSPAILKVAAPGTTDLYSASPLAPPPGSPEQRDFASAYMAEYHTPINPFAAMAWDAAHILAAGITEAHGNTSGPALEAALQSGKPIPAVEGTYHFSATDHNGLTAADVHVVMAHGDMWGAP